MDGDEFNVYGRARRTYALLVGGRDAEGMIVPRGVRLGR